MEKADAHQNQARRKPKLILVSAAKADAHQNQAR
jgi:hypothetical protein